VNIVLVAASGDHLAPQELIAKMKDGLQQRSDWGRTGCLNHAASREQQTCHAVSCGALARVAGPQEKFGKRWVKGPRAWRIPFRAAAADDGFALARTTVATYVDV
jgi:hypothetical protein